MNEMPLDISGVVYIGDIGPCSPSSPKKWQIDMDAEKLLTDNRAVASLRLVSPGAATDGVTVPFFPQTSDDHLSSHRPLKSDDLC